MRIIWPRKYRAISLYLLSFLLIAAHANAQGNFALTVAPASMSIVQGSQATGIAITTVSGGFNNPISLSASGAPLGTLVTFSPTTIPAPGAGTATMRISVIAITKPGTYSITIAAGGGGIKQTATVAVTVMTPIQANFSLTANPSSLTVVPGHQATSVISTAVSHGFNSAVSLSASGMPSGTTVGFNPQTIPAPGSGSSTMTVTVGSNTPLGTYAITVSASGGGVHQAVAVALTVAAAGGLTLSVTPTSLTLLQGAQIYAAVTTRITGGFNSGITLAASGAPLGVLISLNPSSIPAPGVGNSTMLVSATGIALPGADSITITATSSGNKSTVVVPVTILAQTPNYTLSSAPAALTVTQGSQGNSSITAAVRAGFNSAISLSASGAPSGTALHFSENSIPAPGSGNAPVNVTVGSNTPTGTYPITVNGNGGGIQQNTTLTLNVIPAGAQALTQASFMEPYSLLLVHRLTPTSSSWAVFRQACPWISRATLPGHQVLQDSSHSVCR
jgi:hypothetical protein